MRIFILLFMLAPLFLWGQYPDNPRKLRLGFQTTGAGLTYIKDGAPTHTPGDDEDAWMVLDTTNNVLYYWDETAGAWENILDDISLPADNVTGTGVSGQVAYWNGAYTLTGSTNLTYTSPLLTLGGTGASLLLTPTSAPVNAAGKWYTSSGNYPHFMNGTTDWPLVRGAAESFTTGSVLFSGTSGQAQQDNSNIFWNDTDNWLGLGTNSASSTIDAKLRIVGSGASASGRTGILIQNTNSTSASQIRLLNSSNNGFSMQATSSGFGSGEAAAITSVGDLTFSIATNGNAVSGGVKGIQFQLGGYTNTNQVIFEPANTGANPPVELGLNTLTPAYTIDVQGTAALRLNPSSAPVNASGVWYSSSTNRPHFMDGTTDWALVRSASESFTTGSVLFSGTSGQAQQDNANFFWDDTNNRLGIGTTSPDGQIAAQSGDYQWVVSTNATVSSITGNQFGSVNADGSSVSGRHTFFLGDASIFRSAGGVFIGDIGSEKLPSAKLNVRSGSGTLLFLAEDASNNPVLAATMSDRRVGIGTSSPQRTAHIAGEARITDLTTDTPTRVVGADPEGDLGEIIFTSTYIPIGSSGSLTENSGLKYVSTAGSRLLSSDGRLDLNTIGEEQSYTGASLTESFFVDVDPDWEPAQDSIVLSLLRLRHRGTSNPGSGGTRRLLLHSEDASGGARIVQLFETGLKLNRGSATTLYNKFTLPTAWLEIGETTTTDSYIKTYSSDDGTAGSIVHDFRQDYTKLGTHKFNTDQTVGATQAGYVERYNHSSGEVELSPVAQSGSGAPAVAPRFNGDRYFDYTNSKWYSAWDNENVDGTGDGLDTDDWIILN